MHTHCLFMVVRGSMHLSKLTFVSASLSGPIEQRLIGQRIKPNYYQGGAVAAEPARASLGGRARSFDAGRAAAVP